MTTDQLELWRRFVVDVAEHNLGFGETEGNNRGPFLRAIGAPDGAEWCAYLAWYAHRRAAFYAQIELPYKGSGGAKRLGDAIAACPYGFTTTVPARALPGDIIITCRRKGPVTSWGAGHARIVVAPMRGDGCLPYIEGNAGAFPAKVRRGARDFRSPRERLVHIVGLRAR